MLNEEKKASATCLFLAKMTARVEALWPKDETRIPFYQKDWIDRQIKQNIDLISKKTQSQKRRRSKRSQS